MAQILLASTTVGSGGTSSVTLGSGGTIPQTYTDLLVRISARCSTSNGGYQHAIFVRPNAYAGSYQTRWFQGEGSSTVNASTAEYFGNSTVANAGNLVPSDWTASYFSVNEIYIPQYRGDKYKTLIADSYAGNNAATTSLFFGGSIYPSTSAITSLVFTPSAGNFVEFSTFYLYGIS